MDNMNGLVLSRRAGESFQIKTPQGFLITVTVTEQRGSQVKLNINADSSVKIMRSELLSRREAND